MMSVVIVSWDDGTLLSDCLASVFADPPAFPFEVIVVDNGSRDGSPERVRRGFPAARLIENQTNRGFAAACNQGATVALGKYLLFLNPDTRVHAGSLGRGVSFMERHEGTGVLGCRTLNPDGSLQNTARTFPTPMRAFANVSGLSRRFTRLRLKARAGGHFDYVQGSFLMIRRELFERLGGFDQQFFLFGDDVDLCLRVRRAGLAIAYDPDTVITHLGGGRKQPFLRTAHFITSSLLFYGKHRGTHESRRLARLIRLALVARFLGACSIAPGSARAKMMEYRQLSSLLDEARERLAP